MSYTFLPYTEQQGIKREYRLRVFIVFLFFLSIALIVGVSSLFPAYVYSVFAEKLHLDQVATFKKSVDSASIQSTQQQLNQSSGLMNALGEYAQQNIYYSTIESIVALRGAVTISSFALDYTANPSVMKISLAGVAPTRNDLLSFKTRLNSLGKKVVVDLPISALTHESNISFSIQVTDTL